MKAFYIMGFIAAILASGCQNQDENIISQKGKEITVVTNVSRASVENGDMNQFSLYIDQSDNNYDYNVMMKKDIGTDWKAYTKDDENKSIEMEWGDNDDVLVTAVYSDNNLITDLTAKTESISLPTIQKDEDMKKYDVLTYCKTISQNDKKSVLNISFKHLLSKICVTPDVSEITGTGYSIKSISLCNIKNSYTWTPTIGSSSIEAVGENNNTITFLNNGDGTFECIMVPQAIGDEVKLSIIFQKDGSDDVKSEETFIKGSTIGSGECATINNLKIGNVGRSVSNNIHLSTKQIHFNPSQWSVD